MVEPKDEDLDGVQTGGRGEWKYMCIRQGVSERLDSIRQAMAKKIGFKLSWTKFFSLVADQLEKQNGKKAV